MKNTTVLMIMDGFGINENPKMNAVAMANTPNLDRIFKEYSMKKGYASGLSVGLPDGQMGNSEVGHMNMGAGRIVYQELTRITKEIEDGTFFENPALKNAMENVKKHGTSLHLMGLLSDGGVHSHNTHLYALIEMAKRMDVENVYIHCFLDGRDTPPCSGAGYIKELEEKIKQTGKGKIASVSGRYYAMDRDNRWEREEKAYAALTLGEGVLATDPVSAVEASYKENVTDEFVVPCVICEDGIPVATVKDNDSIIFFNFRPDRARQLTRIFCCDDFDGFKRSVHPKVHYVCFTEYDVTIPNKEIAFKKVELKNTFGEYLSSLGKTQLRLAETEKYAHVTFFFNGGVEEPNEGEERILVPSPKVATYDLKPEMSAPLVCEKLIEALRSHKYDVIVINFANPDMVGHTGVLEAAVKAVETVDGCVGETVKVLNEENGQMFLCADHGNCEMMEDYETAEPMTAHTTNPVPFVLINYKKGYTLKEDGRLCDIVPTLLEMMDIEKPKEMTGESLLVKEE